MLGPGEGDVTKVIPSLLTRSLHTSQETVWLLLSQAQHGTVSQRNPFLGGEG
jgi:hypothetical protein